MKRRLRLCVLAPLLLLAACTSPGQMAAYEALDQGWQRIAPLAEKGLVASPEFTEPERQFIRQTFINHQNLITELKNGDNR